MVLVSVCVATLNNWALDFTGNVARIKESIVQAKNKGASFRVCLVWFLSPSPPLHCSLSTCIHCIFFAHCNVSPCTQRIYYIYMCVYVYVYVYVCVVCVCVCVLFCVVVCSRSRVPGMQTGPELEVTGYACGDHFLEPDTVDHAWECLVDIMMSSEAQDIVCDVGM